MAARGRTPEESVLEGGRSLVFHLYHLLLLESQQQTLKDTRICGEIAQQPSEPLIIVTTR